MKRLYLSGPGNLPDLNFPAFHSMAARLRAAGHQVVNPAEINPNGGTWDDCVRYDIATLMDGDRAATLLGLQRAPPQQPTKS